MAYEFLAAGVKPADPFGGFMRGLEQGTQFQQNRDINAVNIEAAKNRNATAGIELQQAKKQVEAETQWSKLPRDEAGNVDPAADKQYRAQYPEYWETRKKAEIAQSSERLQLVGETLKTGAALFANVKTPGDAEKVREWSKQNLEMDPGEFSAEVYGLASQYSDELAKRTEQRRQDMATAVANKDYDVINVLEKQQADDQEAANLKTRLAQLELGQKAAAIRASDASANKSNAQAEAARSPGGGQKAPAGMRWKPDGSQEPIPGGSVDLKLKAQKKVESAAHTATVNILDQEIRNIDKLIGAEDGRKGRTGLHPGLNAAVGPVDARLPTVIPDTADAEALILGLQSKASIGALKDVRSGGSQSIGTITEREWPRLESMKVALQASQSDGKSGQFVSGLREYREELLRAKRDADNAMTSFLEEQHNVSNPDSGDVSSLSDEEVKKGAGL